MVQYIPIKHKRNISMPKVLLQIRVDQTVKDRLAEIAKHQNRNISNMAETILKRAIKVLVAEQEWEGKD
jgi:predicted transcriptional regulator